MKILVFAAHPDDAETTVAGSIGVYIKKGHSVHIVNMTNKGGPRVACAEKSADIFGATVEFLPFEDSGECSDQSRNNLGVQFDSEHLNTVLQTIELHKPDLVWAHWPVDTHPDHIATGALVLRACDLLRLEEKLVPDLWFFSPCLGYQALCFKPDIFIDVTEFIELKKQVIAVYNGVVPIMDLYKMEEEVMKYNGFQHGCFFAEGFVRCNFRIGKPRYEVI